MNGPVINVLQQLLWQMPVLLTYLAAMVVAVIYWARYPKPSLLLLSAMGLLIAVGVGQTVLHAVIIAQRENLGIPVDQIGASLQVTGFVASMFRVVALGLLVMAVYSGRTPAPEPWIEERST